METFLYWTLCSAIARPHSLGILIEWKPFRQHIGTVDKFVVPTRWGH
nr:hypothetical protein [Dolichospermum planctonicum]